MELHEVIMRFLERSRPVRIVAMALRSLGSATVLMHTDRRVIVIRRPTFGRAVLEGVAIAQPPARYPQIALAVLEDRHGRETVTGRIDAEPGPPDLRTPLVT